MDTSMANTSDVIEFVLIGFPGLPEKFHILVSFVMFLVYVIAMLANGTVLILIFLKNHLHHPMYIIIGNLAFSDLLFDTSTLPKMIGIYWFGGGSISFSRCMIQLFLVHWLGSVDSFIIMFMAIDRYIAICNPLRYSSLMSNTSAVLLCFAFWLLAGIFGITNCLMVAMLPFCGQNIVKNCFCSNTAITILACKNVTTFRRITFGFSMIVLFLPLGFIILSYMLIIKTICSSSRSESWGKAFYTCTTHLFVISLFFLPRLFIYISSQVPLIINGDLKVVILCIYTFVPHVANPIIYCLRTQEIKRTLGNVFKVKMNKTEDLQAAQ